MAFVSHAAADTTGSYTCVIEAACIGIWTDCVETNTSGNLEIPEDRGAVTLRVDGQEIIFEDVALAVPDQPGVSAAGLDPTTGRYGLFSLVDGQMAVILSGDSEKNGLFYAAGSFAGTCERTE